VAIPAGPNSRSRSNAWNASAPPAARVAIEDTMFVVPLE